MRDGCGDDARETSERDVKASILIPTYNRQGLLRGALASIQRLAIPAGWRIEVIVVDNASTDGTAEVIDAAGRAGPLPVARVLESKQGLNHGRNRGLLESSADWMIYLDDDMLIEPDWLVGFAEAVGTLDADAVVGPVQPWFEEPPPAWLTSGMIRSVSSSYSQKGEKTRVVEPARAHEFPGCNFAVRRSIALAVGGFHPSLDRVGQGMLSGGDFEFGIKVARMGGRVVYAPRCKIKHFISKKKLSIEGLRARSEGGGATARALAMLDGRTARRHRVALFWLAMMRARIESQLLRVIGCRRWSFERELVGLFIRGWLFGAPPLQARPWPPVALETGDRQAHDPRIWADGQGATHRGGLAVIDAAAGHDRSLAQGTALCQMAVIPARVPAPLVSVIIPCCNAEAWIGEAIDSVLAQTYRHIEVIVVDDGSTDASLGIIKGYGECVHWQTGPNRGGGAARNRGLGLARGEYVLFLDADDTLYPHMIERMVSAALSAGDGAAPLCDRDEVPEKAVNNVTPVRNGYDGSDPMIFFLRTSPQTSAVLHRRTAIEAVGGFNETLPCCQEKDLHLRLATDGMRLISVPEILFRVHRRAGSVSSSYVKVLRQHVSIYMRLRDALQRTGQLTPARIDALAHALSRDGRHLVRAGEPSLAEASFAAACRIKANGDKAAFHHPLSRAAAAAFGALRTEVLIQRSVALLR